MAELSEPLRENETGPFGELAKRPNPDSLVILAIPPIEDLIRALQQRLDRELTPGEIEAQRRKAPAIVASREAAEKVLAQRSSKAQPSDPGRAASRPGRLPPTVKCSYDEMPADAKERTEAAVELFGQHVFSLRNQLVERLRRFVESADDRGQLGTLHRKEYDAVAALDATAQEAALALARKAIESCLQDILMLFTGTGDSLSLGGQHAINYRLTLQVKEIITNTVVDEFDINRECEKVFYTYYARWLNRYGQQR